ncbi:hypothetical protein N9Z83_00645, partial [Akkermansiaceae bacterium]|nr:hypothetical protein [Akkermansiaceae bacterium]
MTKTVLLSLLGTAALSAGEHVVKAAPFETSLSVEATFLPGEATVLKLYPEQWTNFEINEVLPHGTAVKKGDTIIAFDREDYDKHLAETKKDVALRKIALARAERELSDLEINTPRLLEGEEIAFERHQESLAYFKKTSQAILEKEAHENLDRSKRSLEYVEEELKQLLQMYKEDGVTEETEEIILKRQRSAVETAKFSLEKATLATKRTLEKTIPERAFDLQRAFDTAKLSFETAKLNLPRTLEEKKLSVAKQKRQDIETDKKLADLEADGNLFEFKAPADGFIYYGEISDHSWSLGSTSKFLFVDGAAPAKTAILSFVPSGAPLELHSSIDQKQCLQLSAKNTGSAEVDGLENLTFPVEITQLDQIPAADGKYRLAMKITLPEDTPLVGGMKAKVKLITYRNEKALTAPKSAIKTEGS